MLKSFILLFLIHHHVSSLESLYSEMQRLGGYCFPQDSCANYRTAEEDHLWNNFTCECGPHCVKFSTCCADSPNFGKLLYAKSSAEKCQKIQGMSNAVMLVSQCPDRWPHWHQIRNMCEKAKAEIDPVAMTPVTNVITQVTYKNYFCALCNCGTQDLFFWNTALYFKNKESSSSLSNVTDAYIMGHLIYHDTDKSWGIMDNDIFHPMKLKFVLPIYLSKYVKKCYINIVSQCDPRFKYASEFQHKCLSYYAPIKLEKGQSLRKYRNIHCALCNEVSTSQAEINMCKLDLDVDTKKHKTTFSFALLLDINTNDGDLVGKVELCDKNEKWDPFYKKCRSLVCALPGYVLKDRKCVQN